MKPAPKAKRIRAGAGAPKRDIPFTVKGTAEEIELIQRACDYVSLSYSAGARMALLAWARSVLPGAGWSPAAAQTSAKERKQ